MHQTPCALCLEIKPLEKSHILPRSYFKGLKQDSGQLIIVKTDPKIAPRKSNSDPKEYLLCKGCEIFLSDEYEQYGTRLFKNKTGRVNRKESIKFNGFKYKTFYLFLISILWRASITTLKEFEVIKFPDRLSDLLRQSIQGEKIKINGEMRLDHFIKISVLKVVDHEGELKQGDIDSALLFITPEVSDNPKDGGIFFFMIDGFLIIYYLYPGLSVQDVKSKKIKAQLINKKSIIVPKVDIRELKQVHQAFAAISNNPA